MCTAKRKIPPVPRTEMVTEDDVCVVLIAAHVSVVVLVIDIAVAFRVAAAIHGLVARGVTTRNKFRWNFVVSHLVSDFTYVK